MNRRALIRGLLGGAAAASAMGPKEAARAMGLPLDLGAGTTEVVDQVAYGQPSTDGRGAVRMLYTMRHVEDRARGDQRGMPYHIRDKRSWSASFKASVYRRELMIVEAAIEAAERDEAVAEKLLAAFTGGRT